MALLSLNTDVYSAGKKCVGTSNFVVCLNSFIDMYFTHQLNDF